MKYEDDDIVVVGANRSIVGSTSKSLKDLSAAKLGYYVLDGMLGRLEKQSKKFSRNIIKQMILGLCVGAGLGQNMPRQISELCRIPILESAFTVNELCGSSLEALLLGIQSIKLDEYPVVIAGGVESMSKAPYLITQEELVKWQDMKVLEIQTMVTKSDMYDALWCKIFDVHTIVHAENTTAEWVGQKKYDPEDVKDRIDQYAVLSNKRALEAIASGAFKEEIIIIPGTSPDDELPADKNPEKMKKRRGTQFTPDGIFLSNQNSPPPANAAAFSLIMKAKTAYELGLKPLVKITAYGKSGIKPENFLLAPIMAVKQLLDKTNTRIEDYDLMEMNTAFGSQMIINSEELGLDMDKVNIYGDCVAFGHPIGAAGIRLLTTLIHALKRENKKTGLMSICLGGGNALALAVAREE